MKGKTKFILVTILMILSLITSIYLLYINMSTYAIVFITLTLILLIVSISSIPRNKSEEAIYNSELKQILKRYDAILAEIGNTPNLDDKNVMLITNIEDMVDAAVEIRKPIYYKKEEDHCIFSLLDNQDMCIYILKENADKESEIELSINTRKQNIERNISDSRTRKKNKYSRSKHQKMNSITSDVDGIKENEFYNQIKEKVNKELDEII